MTRFAFRLQPSHRAIIENASTLVGTAAVTSGLGVVYWWLAARQFSTGAVGSASAAIASMTLFGTIGMLGFGTFLMGELPKRRGAEGSLISSGIIASGVSSLLLGILFASLAPLISPNLGFLRASVLSVLTFGAGVALTGVTLVLDQAMIGLLRGRLQLARNTVFAAGKLVVLGGVSVLLADRSGLSIYATWAIGNAVSLLFLVAFTVRHLTAWEQYRPRWQEIRGIGGSALSHHALNLSLQAPTLGLPLLVAALISIQANGIFYIAWMVSGLVFVGPLALSIVLYTADAADPAALEQKVRLTLGLALVIGVCSNVVLLVAGGRLLAIFGHDYEQGGRVCLSLLTLAVFPLIIKDHYVALSRIRGRVLRAATLTTAGGCLELAGAALGARLHGLNGLSIGWGVALLVESTWMGNVVLSAALGASAASDLTVPEGAVGRIGGGVREGGAGIG